MKTSQEILRRLNNLEDSFLSGLQELRSIRAEIERNINDNGNLEVLMDAEQLAELLGVEPGYVYSQARSKKIPSIVLGKYRKFSRSQIKRWLDRKNTP